MRVRNAILSRERGRDSMALVLRDEVFEYVDIPLGSARRRLRRDNCRASCLSAQDGVDDAAESSWRRSIAGGVVVVREVSPKLSM